MSVTLKDVSRLAGVGLSTASYVINRTGLHKVSAATCERVLSAARELRYTPNISGRALAKGKTYMAGAIFPNITGSFLAEILQGLEDALNEASYSLILRTCKSVDDFYEKLHLLSKKQLDGLVLFLWSNEARPILPEVCQRIPAVSVAKISSIPDVPSVYVDGEAINYLAVKYLISKGHRSIAINGSDPSRLQGARRAAKETSGVKLSFTSLSSVELLLDWGFSLERKPTAYLICGDLQAIELMAAAQDRGLKMPKDLSVIGVNGERFGTLVRPRLTSVSQPRFEQGYEAGKILLRRINGETCQDTILQPTLIERDSVASV